MPVANELKRKQVILLDDMPCLIMDVTITTPSARGAATLVHLKVRNLRQGTVQERTCKSTEAVREADVEMVTAAYLYRADDIFYFMDQSTFEMREVNAITVGDAAAYLVENLAVRMLLMQNVVLALELPSTVVLTVEQTVPPAVRAGSAGAGTKPATLVGGRKVKVPQYITAGEQVRVNTETGEVLGRA